MSFDMTRGKPAGLMVRFALPLILSAIVQQLYTLCDSVIVGRLLGENAFASVGGAAFLHGIPLSILLGGTQGFGVAIGQRFGAKDGAGLPRFFSAAGALTLSVSLALSGLGLGFLKPLLALMKTPDQLVSNSALYLTVLWSGFPAGAVCLCGGHVSAVRLAGCHQRHGQRLDSHGLRLYGAGHENRRHCDPSLAAGTDGALPDGCRRLASRGRLPGHQLPPGTSEQTGSGKIDMRYKI